jgi:hypothetical protein
MDDPELGSDEKVLARADMVRVKSIVIEAILTSRRIILADKIKGLLPRKEIPLTTIKNVKPGENAIREQVITFTILTNTGDSRQMVLTFSREGGGNRKKERDEWIRLINDQLTPPLVQVIPDCEPLPKATEYAAVPKIRVAGPPITPAPGATSGSYCTRCGKRVPDGSWFCNYCGTRVEVPDEGPPAPAPRTPAAAIKKERPIDQEIHFTEPLVRRSMEKVPADSLRGVPPDSPARPPVLQPWTPAPLPAKPAGKRFITRLFSPKEVHPTPQEQRKPKSEKKVVIAIGIIVIILIIVAAIVLVLPKIMSGSAPSAGTPVTTTSASAETATPGVTPAATVTLQSQQTPQAQIAETCAIIGGVICSSDETCTGSMVNTTDSSRCCAGTCV